MLYRLNYKSYSLIVCNTSFCLIEQCCYNWSYYDSNSNFLS